MSKKRYLKKNKDNIINVYLLAVLFVILSLIVPAIGVGASSPALWVTIVVFFESVQTHFAAFWMFYAFSSAVLFGFFNHK